MPFEVSIAGVDLFADGKRPRALVAKVEKSPSLEQLRTRVVNVARGCGIAVDRRRFRPHVTLARFGAWAEAGHHLAQFVAGNNLVRAGPWLSESFLLYRSRMAPDGAVYTVEAEYPLGW
jgi:2'-5' RNA ligase